MNREKERAQQFLYRQQRTPDQVARKKAYMLQWRAKNRKHLLEYSRKRYHENASKIYLQQKARPALRSAAAVAADREYKRIWIRKWRENHPEQARTIKRAWRSRNRAKELARRRELAARPEAKAKASAAHKKWSQRQEVKQRNRERNNAWVAANRQRILEKRRQRYRQAHKLGEEWLKRREEKRALKKQMELAKNSPERVLSREAKIKWRLMSDGEVIAKRREIERAKAADSRARAYRYYWKHRDRIRRRQNELRKTYTRLGLPRTGPPRTPRKRWTNAEYRTRRKANDPEFKLRCSMTTNMQKRFATLRVARAHTTWKLIGCTVGRLRMHLESQFEPGMSWDNYGFRGWHVDHIRPLSSFRLSDPAEQMIAWNYKNLRPLWAEANWRKGCRFEESIERPWSVCDIEAAARSVLTIDTKMGRELLQGFKSED